MDSTPEAVGERKAQVLKELEKEFDTQMATKGS